MKKRLDTIFNQTEKDWEIIASDNLSDDGTWEILQEAARCDSRIRIFQNPRIGMYQNFNECLRRCTGEYVHIATADDLITPEFLEILGAVIKSVPGCIAAHCNYCFVDETGQISRVRKGWISRRILGESLQFSHVRDMRLEFLLNLFAAPSWAGCHCLVFRRDALLMTGFFPEDTGTQGDCEWAMRLGLFGKVAYISRPMAFTGRHDGQASIRHARLSPKRDLLLARIKMASSVFATYPEAIKRNFGRSMPKEDYFLRPLRLLADSCLPIWDPRRWWVRWMAGGGEEKLSKSLIAAFHRMRAELGIEWPPVRLNFSQYLSH